MVDTQQVRDNPTYDYGGDVEMGQPQQGQAEQQEQQQQQQQLPSGDLLNRVPPERQVHVLLNDVSRH